jgi:hypothetical protein
MLHTPLSVTCLEKKELYKKFVDELTLNGYIFCEDLDTSILPAVIASGELVMITCERKSCSYLGSNEILLASEKLIKLLSSMRIVTFKR